MSNPTKDIDWLFDDRSGKVAQARRAIDELRDKAISEYKRGEERDKDWLRASLQDGIISFPTIELRLQELPLAPEEMERVSLAIAEDKRWIEECD